MVLKKLNGKSANGSLDVPGIVLSNNPAVYFAAIPGHWLVDHSTPSWRATNPKKGFQRIVKERRAKEIARTVLERERTFPNSITLATDKNKFKVTGPTLHLPSNSKFLVVDGQHRLWAQKFSRVSGVYPCIIHMDRDERQMAELFLEINDKQKRVPSSLRWDLVRLVKSEDLPTQMTADIVFELAERDESPFQTTGIDLTGEKKEFIIKQGSLAPEIRNLLKKCVKQNGSALDFESYLDLFIRFFVAIRALDPDGWGVYNSTYYRAKVFRALIRVLADMLARTDINKLTTDYIYQKLKRIKKETLSDTALRKNQGSAGVRDLYLQIKAQVLRGSKG